MTTKTLKFRPYARLLTMLGDQLIKNERIALVEVIKNAYDADASWVKVTFERFDAGFHAGNDARIVIEDDGTGMTRDVIENHWVNPATPIKWIGKQAQPTTGRGRVIQGEKGIGRFALLKLGRCIRIVTRPDHSSAEFKLKLDLSTYDENFIADRQPLFLDDLSLRLTEVDPATTIRKESIELGEHKVTRAKHGTRITVSHLTSTWSREKVRKVFDDLARLQSIFEIGSQQATDPFEVVIHRDDAYEAFSTMRREQLDVLLHNHAVLKVENGRYDQKEQVFAFSLNGKPMKLQLTDPDVTGLGAFRRYFGKDGQGLRDRGTRCGSFSFAFYVFDFSNKATGEYRLDSDDQMLIKAHRIYLYRDGIRVYPYGDPDDDWLQIDVSRGTIRASTFVSNDQVVGHVNISQGENPELRDKTSREGLIDVGQPTDDFRALLQIFLAWIRKGPYGRYLEKLKTREGVKIYQHEQVRQALDEAVQLAAETAPAVKAKLSEVSRLYKAERKYLVQRAETTEHLAGVGLSVETASHDLMVAMHKSLSMLDALMVQSQGSGVIDNALLNRDLTTLRGALSFIESQLKNVQLLFKSTKQRRKDIRVVDQLDKVQLLFQSILDKANIKVEREMSKTPLVAKTTDAVLLQLLLNLFDNAVYWLQSKQGARKIAIRLDGDECLMTFSDNGPGIKAEDVPYIFEPFYSGKGEDGRGLGLYIARQLLERHGYGIDLATKSQRILSGANFVVTFIQGGAE